MEGGKEETHSIFKNYKADSPFVRDKICKTLALTSCFHSILSHCPSIHTLGRFLKEFGGCHV